MAMVLGNALVVVAPELPHADVTGLLCNLETYRQRMWCRMENLCFLMSNSVDNMFVATGVTADDDASRGGELVPEGCIWVDQSF